MAMNQSCYALASKTLHPLLVYFYTLQVVRSLKHKATGAVFDAIITKDFETEKIRFISEESMQQLLSVIEPNTSFVIKCV